MKRVSLFIFLWLPALTFAVTLSGITWNTNGAGKLRDRVHQLARLRSVDVVFLQETLHTSYDSCLLLEGFVGHHVLATPTDGRPSQGLSSFFRIGAFVDGSISRVSVPVDWLLVSRCGVLFINVYVPLHSKPLPSELDFLRDTILDLQSCFPGDIIIMGGDFNHDPWRNTERRARGQTLSPLVRHLESVIEDLSPELIRLPTTRAFTFADADSRSSLDHWFVSHTAVQVVDCEAVDDSTCQHLPLRLLVRLDRPVSDGLELRSTNLLFTPAQLRLVRAQLYLLANGLKGEDWEVNRLYRQIIGCFTVYGLPRSSRRSCQNSEQWTTFLTDDERSVSFPSIKWLIY